MKTIHLDPDVVRSDSSRGKVMIVCGPNWNSDPNWNSGPNCGSMDALTRRQRDVLYLIVQGRTNKEIARSLRLGEGTVKVHVAALFGKLGVHRRAAVAVAGSRFLSPGALKSA